ncbi:SHPS1 phosphatase, partial [Bucorvus abyssinicus]|nr:SHPS1 phosphatase [Bucorvus abyssinicus]
GAQTAQRFELRQPQDRVTLTAGQTLTLTCTVSGTGPPGPMKWLKGWGSGNKTVYEETGTFPRVTRVQNGSNSDFSIRIGDAQPEDAGTYHCVKFSRSVNGVEVFDHGKGTEVSVHETTLVPTMVAAAAVLCFLLLGLLVAFCLYRRKRQGEADSQGLARLAATGSFVPIPLRCCARTPRFVPTTSSFCTPRRANHLIHAPHPGQGSQADNDIHYADLQPLPAAPRHGRSPGAAHSEYASVRVAAK